MNIHEFFGKFVLQANDAVPFGHWPEGWAGYFQNNMEDNPEPYLRVQDKDGKKFEIRVKELTEEEWTNCIGE